MNNHLKKCFSIFGDSISTLQGYHPSGYSLFYEGDTCERTGVRMVEDTWWGQVIAHYDGELLVNNSWSGSRVAKLTTRLQEFPSGCSKERTFGLHKDGRMPDVIIVYLGTNDWAYGVPVENERREFYSYTDEKNEDSVNPVREDADKKWVYQPNEVFPIAYQNMIFALHENYPDAVVWCCTIAPTKIAKNPDWVFPEKFAGIHVETYNQMIRKIARACEWCRLVDLYSFQEPYDAIDGSHPTAEGMRTISQLVIRSVGDVFSQEDAHGILGQSAKNDTGVNAKSRMSTVYASPEQPECRPINVGNVYDTLELRGFSGDFKEQMMGEVYGGPEPMSRESEDPSVKTGSKNGDRRARINSLYAAPEDMRRNREKSDYKWKKFTPETDSYDWRKETLRTCPQCGKGIPLSEQFCRYCGKNLSYPNSHGED